MAGNQVVEQTYFVAFCQFLPLFYNILSLHFVSEYIFESIIPLNSYIEVGEHE